MATPAFFRKKPVTISAMQFDGTTERAEEIKAWMAQYGDDSVLTVEDLSGLQVLKINNAAGSVPVLPAGWVGRTYNGLFLTFTNEEFFAIYEPV